MRRETQNILLVLLGGALLKIALNGTYLRYVKPSQQIWLIGAGLVMVLLAAIAIIRDLQLRPRDEKADLTVASGSTHGTPSSDGSVTTLPDVATGSADGLDEHDGHGHHHSSRSAWLLLLPVFAVFLIAPPALGSDSVNRAASRSSTQAGSALFPPLPPADVVPMGINEFANRAAWDKAGRSVDGRKIQLLGFIVKSGGDTFVARLSIGCCAADAYPAKVKLDGPNLSGLANDTWVSTVVVVHPGSADKDTDYVPSATVESLNPVPQPEDPYEH